MNEQNLNHENWDEIRIAYHVARLGTLSAAAAHLGVHHATIIRRIDALEARLGSKLFNAIRAAIIRRKPDLSFSKQRQRRKACCCN